MRDLSMTKLLERLEAWKRIVQLKPDAKLEAATWIADIETLLKALGQGGENK